MEKLRRNYKTFPVSTTQPKNKQASNYIFLTKLNIETNMKSIKKKRTIDQGCSIISSICTNESLCVCVCVCDAQVKMKFESLSMYQLKMHLTTSQSYRYIKQ